MAMRKYIHRCLVKTRHVFEMFMMPKQATSYNVYKFSMSHLCGSNSAGLIILVRLKSLLQLLGSIQPGHCLYVPFLTLTHRLAVILFTLAQCRYYSRLPCPCYSGNPQLSPPWTANSQTSEPLPWTVAEGYQKESHTRSVQQRNRL